MARALRRKTAKTRSYTAIRKNRWEDSGDEISLGYQKEILTTTCMVTSWASKRRPSLIRENPFEGFKLPASPEHAYDYWGLEDEDKFFEWIEGGAYYEKVTTRYRNAGKSQYSMQLQLRNHEELRDIVIQVIPSLLRSLLVRAAICEGDLSMEPAPSKAEGTSSPVEMTPSPEVA